MKYRYAMLLLWISLPICVILKAIQVVFTIDNDTGFIKQQYSAISMLITVIICAAIAAVSLMTLACRGLEQKENKFKPAVAAASVLLGGMFIYQSVVGFANLEGGTWYSTLLIILGDLSAFAFLAYGLKNIYEYKMPPSIMVAPVFYYVIRLVSIFISTSELSMVTENVFMLFTNSAILLFVYELAGLENNVGNIAKRQRRIFASSIATILLCTTTSVSKIVSITVFDKDILPKDITDTLLNLSMAIFALLYIICNYKAKKLSADKIAPKHLA